MRRLSRTLTVALTDYNTPDDVSQFLEFAVSLPNLHTLQILTNPSLSPIAIRPINVRQSSSTVRTVVLHHAFTALLRHFPDVLEVSIICDEPEGAQSSPQLSHALLAIGKDCKAVHSFWWYNLPNHDLMALSPHFLTHCE
jgi:hypothetical protein